MKLVRKENDIRGNRWFFEDHENQVTLFEIRKGFARGGQYHKNKVTHILIMGKIEYNHEDVETNQTKLEIMTPYSVTHLMPNNSDLIIALEDSIMIGIYKKEKEQRLYEKHHKIVKEKMNRK